VQGRILSKNPSSDCIRFVVVRIEKMRGLISFTWPKKPAHDEVVQMLFLNVVLHCCLT